MAAPFGLKSLDAYVTWAVTEGGCKAQSGIKSDARGKVHNITRITSPEGKSVVVVGSELQKLTATYLGYLDRRLGIKCPWFTIDENNEPHGDRRS